jgi:hypothetical protein
MRQSSDPSVRSMPLSHKRSHHPPPVRRRDGRAAGRRQREGHPPLVLAPTRPVRRSTSPSGLGSAVNPTRPSHRAQGGPLFNRRGGPLFAGLDTGLLLDQHRVFERYPSSPAALRRVEADELPRGAGRLEHCPSARRALAEACALSLSCDGSTWEDDLAITYRRAA